MRRFTRDGVSDGETGRQGDNTLTSDEEQQDRGVYEQSGRRAPLSVTRSLDLSISSPLATLLLHLTLLAAAFLYLIPALWMIVASFHRQGHAFTLDNFRLLFHREPFAVWLINSLFIASLQTVLVVTLSSLGGFALAKYTFRGKRLLMLLMLATMLLPGVVLLPGYVDLMVRIGWINSYKAIILPGAVSVFGTFLFRQSMLGVPDELLQAGRVDGCSELRLWWDVALPVVRPMVGAFTLLSFLAAWNSYLWPSTVLQDQSKFTVPMGLAGMMGLQGYESQFGVLMAGTLVGILPVAVLFFVLQRDFVSGLASGAVKG
jgi:ABC-type glycerol-3-phosphate transport system permease component